MLKLGATVWYHTVSGVRCVLCHLPWKGRRFSGAVSGSLVFFCDSMLTDIGRFAILAYRRTISCAGGTQADQCSVWVPAGLGVERPVGLGLVSLGKMTYLQLLQKAHARRNLGGVLYLPGVQKALERQKSALDACCSEAT